MPREQVIEPDSGDNMFSRFIDRLSSLVHACARAVYHGLRYVWHKLFSGGHTPVAGQEGSGYGWIMSLQLLLYGLAVVVIAALLVLVLRVWQGRRPAVAAVSSTPVQPVPDIADENVRADQLPEDGWTKLGRELLERGEFRLAMRAFYLASLAHLAGRNLISIARFKSNRDYERELRRRAHALPGLLSVFGDNITVFERIWYGMHEANHELVTQFAANLERMRAA